MTSWPGTDRDDPCYLGLGARAAVYLNLSSRLCPDLTRLGTAIPREGARLYLHAHRIERQGFLRLNLALPGIGYDVDTATTLAHGDMQEFLAVAYQTGDIELHLSQESGGQTLSCGCVAGGVRQVIDRALTDLADADHPGTDADHDALMARIRSELPAVNNTLDPAAAISLTVSAAAPSFVALDVVT